MINRVTFQGYLGGEPHLTKTDGGQSVCNVKVANTVKWKNDEGELKEKTTWATLAFFGHGAETFFQHHHKGDLCLVEGRLSTDNWIHKETGERREKMKIVVENWHFTSKKNQQQTEHYD